MLPQCQFTTSKRNPFLCSKTLSILFFVLATAFMAVIKNITADIKGKSYIVDIAGLHSGGLTFRGLYATGLYSKT